MADDLAPFWGGQVLLVVVLDTGPEIDTTRIVEGRLQNAGQRF